MTDEKKQKHLYIEFAKYEPYFNSYFSCGDYVLKYGWQQKWCNAVLSSANDGDFETLFADLNFENVVTHEGFEDKNAELQFNSIDDNGYDISIMKKEQTAWYTDMSFWKNKLSNYEQCEDKFIKEQLTEMDKALENGEIYNPDAFAGKFKNWKFGIENNMGKFVDDYTVLNDNTIKHKFITTDYENGRWWNWFIDFQNIDELK